MKFITFILSLILTIFLISCSGVDAPRDRGDHYRDRNERRGRVDPNERREWDGQGDTELISDTPETIVDKLSEAIANTLKTINECKSITFGVPRNELDIVTKMFGLNAPNSQVRECVAENLQRASDKICESQRNLVQMQAEFSKYQYRRERLEAAIRRVRSMEESYKDRLFQMADRLGRHIDRDKNGFGYYLLEQEALAYESIFIEEANTECDAYYTLERNRNRGSSRSRR